MTEDDIHGLASQRGPQPSAPPAVARRGRRPWLLLGVLVLLLLVAASGAAVLLALAEGMGGGVTITIDGERWGPFHPTAERWTLAFGSRPSRSWRYRSEKTLSDPLRVHSVLGL